MIDESTEFGARAARHLREDRVVWLTTVSAAGSPLPTPVWFVWEEPDTVHVFSLPGAARARHVETNPRVSLNFAGNREGGDIVVLSGRATADPDAPAAHEVPAYAEKHADGFRRIGVTPEQFSQRYSVPLRIRLTKLRGH
jgi:PPOX class probable F420-dependent enzyme